MRSLPGANKEFMRFGLEEEEEEVSEDKIKS
jgi:hypothetical protein